MDSPTNHELEILSQFRRNLIDLNLNEKSDLFLLRWLRARDLNILEAEKLLRNHLIWKEVKKIDEVLTWDPPLEYFRKFPYEISGCDTEGRPICTVYFGDWDVRSGVETSEGRSNLIRYVDQMFMKCFAQMEVNSKKFETEVTQMIVIIDSDNLGFKQLSSFTSLSTLLELAKRFESNYPETLHKVFFINGFRLFQIFFSFLKPLLTTRTLGKVEIYTTYDKWQPVLLNQIPKNQLPTKLTGN